MEVSCIAIIYFTLPFLGQPANQILEVKKVIFIMQLILHLLQTLNHWFEMMKKLFASSLFLLGASLSPSPWCATPPSTGALLCSPCLATPSTTLPGLQLGNQLTDGIIELLALVQEKGNGQEKMSQSSKAWIKGDIAKCPVLKLRSL